MSESVCACGAGKVVDGALVCTVCYDPAFQRLVGGCPFQSAELSAAWRMGLGAGIANDGRRNAFDVGAGISIGDWPKLVAWELGKNRALGITVQGEEDKNAYEILLYRLRDAKTLRRGKFCNVDLAGVPLSKPWQTEVFCWREVLDSIAGERR